MTRHLSSYAAIGWQSTGDTAPDRVHVLSVPLRATHPGYAQEVYRSESLDRSTIESFTVESGAHELVGEIRFDDDPQSAIDLLRAGNANRTLTYYPDSRDPDQAYACKLVEPTGPLLRAALDQARGSFGNVAIPVRLRQTDQSAFAELYQGTNVLYWFRGGGSLEGHTFTRATTATRITAGRGTYAAVASGKAVTSWYDADSDDLRELPALGISAARTNLCLQSENFGTTWTTTGSPTRSAAAKTCGTLSLDLLGDDAAGALEGYLQTVTFTGNAAKAVSIHLAQGTSTTSLIQLRDTTAGANRLFAVVTWGSDGVPVVTMTTGTSLGFVPLANGVWRFYLQTTTVTAANTNSIQVYPACDAAADVSLTGDVYAGGVQCENALYPGPYTPTTTATVTRNADVVSAAFTPRPQALTLYARFIELGNVYETSTANRVLQIGNANPRLILHWTTSAYAIAYLNAAGTTVSSAAATDPVLGDLVELMGVLNADGSVQLTSCYNGGTATAASASAAQLLPINWGSQHVYLGSEAGGATGSMGLLNAVVMRGAQSFATMRRVARV